MEEAVRPRRTQADVGLDNEPESGRSTFRTFMILVALYLTLFVAALDQTILATAIPTISSQLHSATGYTWIGGAYLLANAAAGPVWAKISDIFGRKPILLACVLLFFCSSIICALSSSIEMLIAGRALQGVAGGGLIQLVNITISDLFSMKRRALWLGLLETMWAVAGGIGPLLGGTFTEFVSWRWTFWVNLPVTLMILLGLDFGGETFPWNSTKVICLLVFGGATIGVFIFSEKKLAKYPLMPLGLFNSWTNIGTLLVTFTHGIVFVGGEFYIPLYLQSTHQYGPFKSGIMILPITIIEAAMGICSGILTHRWGVYREVIIVGCVLMTIGTGLYLAFTATTSVAEIIGFELIGGAGCGLLFQPTLIAIQAFVHQDDIATATSCLGFFRNLAMALGVLFGGIIFQNSMTKRSHALASSHVIPPLPASVLNKLTGTDAAANVGIIASLSNPAQEALVKEAFSWSMHNMWIFFTCVGVIAVGASLLIKSAVLSEEHTETKTGIKRRSQELAEREFEIAEP